MSLGQGAGTPRLRRGGAALLAFASLGALAASASAAPPTITDLTATQISTTEATLSANVNPNGKATLYHFEYGPQDCSLNPNPCTAVPVPDGRLEGATQALPVSYHLTGLTPLGTYHFRLIAKSGGNEGGETPSPDQTFNTFAPPPGFDPCANESFRALQHAALPDCRAYEQVSPTDKNGNEATGDIDFIQTSPAGDAFTYAAFSGVPGAAGSQNWGTFIAHREPGAWLTTGLLPPTKYGYTALVDGLTTDLAYSFSNPSLGGSTPTTFVAQGTFDGSDTAVAPAAGAVIDGGAGDSLVYFKSTALLAPGGLAGQQNIYLWDRPSGAITFAAHGTEAPIGYVRASHPVSADGQKLYFKDAGQIYLRAGAAGPAPSTAHVSASQRTDCAGDPTCGGDGQPDPEPDPLGSAPASFRFAASDGSRALFTSSEELTDDANTGPVAPPPAIERANASGPPVEESLPITAGAIATDSEHLYWVSPPNNSIGRADLDGGHPDPTFIEIPPRLECPLDPVNARPTCPVAEEKVLPAKPQYVAVDGGHVYWTNERSGNKQSGTIGRAALDGNPDLIEAEWIKGISRPKGIAVNSEYVYWAQAGVAFSNDGAIGRADKDDGGGVILDFAPEAVFGTQRPEGVAIDVSHIYWTFYNQNGNSTVLASAELTSGLSSANLFLGRDAQARSVAVDLKYVYWASQGNEAIGRMPIADFKGFGSCDPSDPRWIPSCNPQFIPTDGKPFGLTADGTDLLWSVNGEVPPNLGNDLYRYQAQGEVLEDLTADGPAPNGAEVIGFLGASEDAESVYFVANGVLADGASAGNCEKIPGGYSGACNLYLSRAGAITFIARLDTSATEKFTSGIQAEANWLTKSGQAADAGFSRLARVSADGNFLLFYSSAQLSAAENHGAYEFYRYSAQTKQIDCLSCPPNGAPPSASVTIDALRFPSPFAPSQPNEVLVRNFSADGTRAFFETGQKMVVTDTDGDLGCPTLQGYNGHFLPRCLDVYEWEAPGAGSCTEASSAYSALNGGCVYLLSAGAGTDPSFFADASASGDRAFIFTREALVPNDGDQQQDIYAASALGGLASQHTAATDPPPCQGDACRGPYSSPPDLPGAASTVFEGLPDPTPKRPRHCPKGTRRVRRAGKTSCVKGHHKRAGKRAGHDHRRGSR